MRPSGEPHQVTKVNDLEDELAEMRTALMA
jgi:hypothetical protein